MNFLKFTFFALLPFTLAGCPMNDVNSQDNSGIAGNHTERSVEPIRLDGNHLVNEPSLYLQQHAHNPIDWYPWGDEALRRAKVEDKPIFLSIGYSSCHWCHVMEHEVFEHDDVANFMNAHFICIKVDREERPDLDAVYMEAVQMMTGRGGWPMSVFLTPDLKPFYGGTYLSKKQFVSLTNQIEEVFRERRGELEGHAGQVADRIQNSSLVSMGEGSGMTEAMITAAAEAAKESFDPAFGGFRQSQKFPTPTRWRFLLHEYRRQSNVQLGEMIVTTCQAMAQGGLYDHVGGGFHRYTVDNCWTVPHFEKMLYDNGQLAGLMLEAGMVFERADFTAAGLDVLDFLLRDMRAEEGGFYASYDADSGGEEGSYYVWDQAEISTVVGQADGAVLAAVLGVSETGNFEHTGKSVLTRRADLQQIARENDRSADEVSELFNQYRANLRAARDKRTPPGLDPKVVTSWNGLAIASLAQGYAVTRQEKYLAGAQKAADFLLKKHRRDDGSLWRTSSDGHLAGEGILDDYAFLADGLLELYQVSGQVRYLAAGRQLIDFALEHFGRAEGAFFMSRAEVEAPLGRRVDFFDSVEPCGNSVMMVNLIRLSALTGEAKYHTRAQNDLDGVSDLLDRAGLEMAWWLDAARRVIGPYYDVVIVGEKNGLAEGKLARALMERLPASAVVSQVASGKIDPTLAKLAPALGGKTAIDGKPTAYVCEFGTCQAPTQDVERMMQQAFGGWER